MRADLPRPDEAPPRRTLTDAEFLHAIDLCRRAADCDDATVTGGFLAQLYALLHSLRPDPVAVLTSTPVVADPTMPTWSSGWRPMRHDEAVRVVAALEGS